MKARRLSCWLLLVAAASLSGCVTSGATLGSLAKPGERAVIVVGVVSSRMHPAQGSGIAAKWLQYDAESEALVNSGGAFTVDRRSECWSRECDRQTRYEAFTVTPGDYILTSVISQRSGATSRAELVSYFVKTKRDWPPGGSSHTPPAVPEGSTAGSGAPRFKVDDGEVVYIGTFAFDTNEWPHRISDIRVDMAAAKAALDAADREKLVFRPPTRPQSKPAS